ncbi:hypothetical protein F5B20DRAFT_547226 [Whalleya microplaca]|nr:hypothetical protein F5B20DRAFT_547226 [Whalleya microplaca]
MPISSTTRRISQKEWADHKDQIVELYLDRGYNLVGSDGVIETMAKKGFTATIAQYEKQFRVWKVRKNMKRSQWAEIIQERQQGEAAPVILSDRVISNSRLNKALRRYAPKMPPADVSVPCDNDDVAQRNTGNTGPPVSTACRHTPVERIASEASLASAGFDIGTMSTASHEEDDFGHDRDIPFFGSTNGTMGMSSYGNPELFNPNMDSIDPMKLVNFNLPAQQSDELALSPCLSLSNAPFSVQFSALHFSPRPTMDIVGTQSPHGLSSRIVNASLDTAAQSISYLSSAAVASPSPPYIAPMHRQILQRDQLMQPLPSAEIVATIVKDIFSTASAHRNVSRSGSWGLADQFWSDINESVKTIRPGANMERSPEAFPLPLKVLLSIESLVGEEQSVFDILPNNVASEARFYSRLMALVMNGFTGLENIPAAGVLRFLNRHQAIQLWMIEFLVSNSSPVAKSLTENIFQAAIEADNVDIVKYLLDHSKLIDANDTICFYSGERYTPFEKATIMGSFGVLRLLISQNANVNKTYSRRNHFSVLKLLLRRQDTKSTIDDEFLNLVDAFLKAKVTISLELIADVLDVFADPRFAIRLIKMYASQAPQELISGEKILKRIVENLEKEYATSLIKLIIEKCRELGGDLCLNQCHLSISDALNKAVERGYQELVGIMFPYTSFPDKTLQLATRTGNRAIIDLILRMNPDLYTGTEYVIAALKSGDQDWLRSLEERGVFNRLQGSHEYGRALTVALKAGNLEYATKILDLDPDFDFLDDWEFDTNAPLRAALTSDFDDIAWKLLAAASGRKAFECSALLVSVVLEKKRPDFVRAMIESGVNPGARGLPLRLAEGLLMQATMKYADDSFLSDLWQAYPSTISTSCRLWKLSLDTIRLGFLWGFLESRLGDNFWMTYALECAIECENIEALDRLIDHGARPDDDHLLELAVYRHPSMIKPLLEQYRKAYPRGRSGYGQTIITEIIRVNPQNSELLDIFFDFNLVYGDILEGTKPKEPLLNMAINPRYNPELQFPNLKYPGRKYPERKYPEIKYPNIHLIKRLLNAGSDVNRITKTGGHIRTTALLDAIEMESTETIQLLIQHGAEVNEPARFGIVQTPLQKAAEVNNLEIVLLLLEKGADVNAAPARFEGATALQFAAIWGNCEMARALIEHGAQLDVPPPLGVHGRWPLEGAAENGRLDMIQFLWNANGRPFDDKQCQKAIRLAERNGHLGCSDQIKELMKTSAGHSA